MYAIHCIVPLYVNGINSSPVEGASNSFEGLVNQEIKPVSIRMNREIK